MSLKVVDWVHVLFVGGGDWETRAGAGKKTYGVTVEDPNWTPMHPTMKRFNVNEHTLMSLPNDGLWFQPEDLTKILKQLDDAFRAEGRIRDCHKACAPGDVSAD